MSRAPNGQKTGIYEHRDIRRDFVFAHGNEHFCLPVWYPQVLQTDTSHLHVRIQIFTDSHSAG